MVRRDGNFNRFREAAADPHLLLALCGDGPIVPSRLNRLCIIFNVSRFGPLCSCIAQSLNGLIDLVRYRTRMYCLMGSRFMFITLAVVLADGWLPLAPFASDAAAYNVHTQVLIQEINLASPHNSSQYFEVFDDIHLTEPLEWHAFTLY